MTPPCRHTFLLLFRDVRHWSVPTLSILPALRAPSEGLFCLGFRQGLACGAEARYLHYFLLRLFLPTSRHKFHSTTVEGVRHDTSIPCETEIATFQYPSLT